MDFPRHPWRASGPRSVAGLAPSALAGNKDALDPRLTYFLPHPLLKGSGKSGRPPGSPGGFPWYPGGYCRAGRVWQGDSAVPQGYRNWIFVSWGDRGRGTEMALDGTMLPHMGRERPRRGLDWRSTPTTSRAKTSEYDSPSDADRLLGKGGEWS